MTRKAKANKEKRSKEPEVERFRSLEELNQEFIQRKHGFRSIKELTKDFQEHQQAHVIEEEPAITHGTGILKKIFEGRGFGFITPDQDHGAGDVFLHFSDVASGGARNLGIGTWVRYDIEPDTASGRLRAKNVTVLPSTPSTTASESPSVSVEGTSPVPSSTARVYNRDAMLGVLQALSVCRKLDSSASLRLTTVPMPPSCASRSADQEDPYLDDERLLAKLEARLDKETGADAWNMQTFGTCSGWSFEEAVAANARLRITTDIEDSTTGSGSFCDNPDNDVSERGEEDSLADSSEDRRETGQAPTREEARSGRRWKWAQASHQAKLLEDHRHSWEFEQNQRKLATPPLQVFQ